ELVPESVEAATGVAPEPAELVAGAAPGPVASATDVALEAAEPVAGITSEPAAAPVTPSSIHTDVDTPPPSVHETVQAGLADIDDRVRDLSAPAVPEPTEQGAVRGEDAATSGALGASAMAPPGAKDIGGTR